MLPRVQGAFSPVPSALLGTVALCSAALGAESTYAQEQGEAGVPAVGIGDPLRVSFDGETPVLPMRNTVLHSVEQCIQ